MIGDKLKEIRENIHMNKKEFATYIGTKYTTYNGYETGTREPDSDFLIMISQKFDISIDYILGLQDEKEIRRSYELKSHEYEHIKKYRALDPIGQSHVNSVLDWETTRLSSLKEKDGRIAELQAAPAAIIELSSHSGSQHLAEYFHDASAGAGIFILGNEAAARIAISDSDWDERTDYVIRVNGDSMEPDYKDGDNVMVSQHMELDHGDIGIFIVNGKAYIKEYGETELISRNPDYPNIIVHEADNIVCMGKVIGKLEGKYEIISN
ncbi:MAG: LexA family transcriptional regulator [Lachnospiraceae bacterium]|nr:LexA family transcriptional regulator [Lachnospiraceae bacterium]